ncbi:MAG: preprotein translocase subunit SecG [Acidobacteria bacterium]|nr:preprotein translocase subunit SecG [Acidobacteriota bacterium]MCI0621230.1 preprotein translocase subunit SecG [Acidobacteriota bacterium]MCI0718100.1 preprotein translocase subunit SecG [Acidobacteriota bacterium]
MAIVLSIIHVLVCLILILIVLLQSGKGADLAGAFGGGGSQTAFGARGTATFLSKLTTGAAVVFMLTSFALSLFTTRNRGSSVMEGAKPVQKQTAPAQPGTAPAPPTQNAPAPAQQNPASPQQKP